MDVPQQPALRVSLQPVTEAAALYCFLPTLTRSGEHRLVCDEMVLDAGSEGQPLLLRETSLI